MNFVLEVVVDEGNKSCEEQDCENFSDSSRRRGSGREEGMRDHVRKIEDDVENHEDIVSVSIIRRSNKHPSSTTQRPRYTNSCQY